MFSDHKAIKLEMKNKNISGKYSNIRKLNNTHLNNPWIKEVMKRGITKYFELNKNENIKYYNLWNAAYLHENL